jgi:Peptidase A4 family
MVARAGYWEESVMTTQETAGGNGVRLCPPPPRDFDPFTATEEDLKRHGLPLRPDPQTRPGMAALWERKARRYRNFEHLEPQFEPATATRTPVTSAAAPAGSLELSAYESCGYELDSFSAPFTALFVTWTVPDLKYTDSPPFGPDPNLFHTFVTLGSVKGELDVHVEMTVDSANTVTSQLQAEFVGNVPLPVSPGDVISGSLCLDAQPPGAGAYFFVNETTRQTMSFPVTTGLPPATFVLAGVSRGGNFQQVPLPALAQFGVVYFDEISAYTTSGPQLLTSGDSVTMTDQNGSALARPEQLNDWAFKVVRQ